MRDAIGVDMVEVNRFAHWSSLSKKTLRRIFSEQEIDYCLLVPALSTQRFAVRFAAREAFFKAAISAKMISHKSFLHVCRLISVVKGAQGEPVLEVDWYRLAGTWWANPRTNLSLSHTKQFAIAVVGVSTSCRWF